MFVFVFQALAWPPPFLLITIVTRWYSGVVVVPLHGKNQSWVEYSSLRTLPVLPMPAWVLQHPPKDMLVRLTVAGVKQRDPQSLTFTPVSNLDSPVNPTLLTACVWTIRRKKSTWREPMQTLGEYSHRKALEPRTLLLWGKSATHCSTVMQWVLIANQ